MAPSDISIESCCLSGGLLVVHVSALRHIPSPKLTFVCEPSLGVDDHTYWDLSGALRSSALGVTLLVFSFHPLVAQEQLLPVFHFNRLPAGLHADGMRSRVVRDDKGFVWLGTVNGLERYDGYSFKDYRNILDDPRSLSSNTIMSLLVSRNHRLWVGTFETGLSLYDAARDRFLNYLPRPGDSTWLQGKSIVALMEDRSGNIWLGTDYGGVACAKVTEGVESDDLDSLAHRIRFRTYPLGTPLNSARDLFEREDGKILVASDSGLIVLDPGSGTLSRLHLVDPIGRRLDTLSLRCTVRDHKDNLWVGSGREGVFKLDPKSGVVLNYRHKERDSLSISSDFVMDIVEEQHGNIWVATNVGLDLFSPVAGACVPYLPFDRAPHLSFYNNLSVDRTGTLWISTGEDGLYWLSPKSQRFPNFSIRNRGGSPRPFETVERSGDGSYWCSSSGDLFQINIATQRVLKSIDVFRGRTQTFWEPDNSATILDARGNLWYGTWGLGLYQITLATGHVKNYGYESLIPKESIAMSIAQGLGDTIWTSAYRDGVMRFDPASAKFLKLPVANFRFPYHVMKDRDGKLWISSEENGVCVYDPATGTTDRFVHDPVNPRSLSHDRTRKTYQDPSGKVWVGAGNVINLWDPATRSFTRYPNAAPEASLLLAPIGSDRRGKLWVTSGYGALSILDPSSGEFTNFDASDGVCGYVVDMENLDDGRVLLAGLKGLNVLNPDSMDLHRAPPRLVITRMAIDDEPVPLPALPNGSGSVRLGYAENVLEFEFSANDIDAPQLVEYQYQLESLEKDWVKPKNRRYVRYTGLPPRDYVFKVRATTSRNEWPPQEIALAISIAPPWWRMTWAYTAYVILTIGLLFAGYRVRLRQVRLQQEVEMEHFEREHLAEVDRLKSRFFANLSHEFRTPLTLILGPLEKLRSKAADEESQHALGMMKRNAHQLLGLINQLLDLSKLEAGGMKLHAARANIVSVVKGIAYSFESSAGMRKIGLNVSAEQDEIQVYFDKDKLERILTNLLSNALKFTPDRGRVTVTVEQSRIQKSELRGLSSIHEVGIEGVSIAVSDTGIGIPDDKLPHVFDRFYQVDDSTTRAQGGTGIGLALVKELVEMHHGTIRVTSQPGVGTEFKVTLPQGKEHLKPDEIVEETGEEESDVFVSEAIAEETESPPEPAATRANDIHKSLVLIVEDNADIREYIRDNLPASYSMMEARDGVEGIDKAREAIPDLIISDVMMPKKDGYELCRTLKNDEKTSHIPIILLTAKAASENKIEGLETGADDYLIKPFEPRELLARVKNLIDLRRRLRERFSAAVPLKPGEIAVTPADDAFLQRVKTIVENRMADEKFSVEELAAQARMSRVQLHRKLTALTNLSASDFIRYMRLHRAMDMLKGRAATVSEIAYQVGFSDPSHFSKSFHKQFGVAPSTILSSQANTKSLPA
jgi:signal transduction histidine kinase/DNA-binding response OmpR family regulator/ligand-binding sensor domain-containing protein